MQNNYDQHRPLITLVHSDLTTKTATFPGSPPRGQWIALLALGVLMLLSVVLLWHSTHTINRFESRLAQTDGASNKLRLYSEQLASLQDRISGFIADSVETRLRTLEQRVANGTVGAAEIQAFEELKTELKLLESYTKGKDGVLSDASRREHPRFQMRSGSPAAVSNSDLLGEVIDLKNLTYFSIASTSLVAVLIGGYWWQYASRLKRLSPELGRKRLLTNGSLAPKDS